MADPHLLVVAQAGARDVEVVNPTVDRTQMLERHGPLVAFYFYCKIMLISISYNYCSVLTANFFLSKQN